MFIRYEEYHYRRPDPPKEGPNVWAVVLVTFLVIGALGMIMEGCGCDKKSRNNNNNAEIRR